MNLVVELWIGFGIILTILILESFLGGNSDDS
jgi:hypothetical protein